MPGHVPSDNVDGYGTLAAPPAMTNICFSTRKLNEDLPPPPQTPHPDDEDVDVDDDGFEVEFAVLGPMSGLRYTDKACPSDYCLDESLLLVQVAGEVCPIPPTSQPHPHPTPPPPALDDDVDDDDDGF